MKSPNQYARAKHSRSSTRTHAREANPVVQISVRLAALGRVRISGQPGHLPKIGETLWSDPSSTLRKLFSVAFHRARADWTKSNVKQRQSNLWHRYACGRMRFSQLKVCQCFSKWGAEFSQILETKKCPDLASDASIRCSMSQLLAAKLGYER